MNAISTSRLISNPGLMAEPSLTSGVRRSATAGNTAMIACLTSSPRLGVRFAFLFLIASFAPGNGRRTRNEDGKCRSGGPYPNMKLGHGKSPGQKLAGRASFALACPQEALCM